MHVSGRPFILALAVLWIGCSSTTTTTTNTPTTRTAAQPEAPSAEQVQSQRVAEFIVLQLNDVYEITPVEGGKRGGLARVATLRKQLLKENPNTFTVLSGDFLSPSALGTAKVDGERLAGKQMVAVLNAVELDFVTFGNHEFDLDRDQFESRLAESEFEYISGNVFDENGIPFPGTDPYRVIEVSAPSGDTLRVGLLAVTAPFNKKDYVSYKDHTEVLTQQVDALGEEVDAFIALTHLTLAQDIALAKDVPELDLILGGHEHENVQLWRGADLTPIVKADANVRSVYIHRLSYDFESKTLAKDIRLYLITDEIPDDSVTAAVVDEWVSRAWEGFRKSGFNPEASVVTITESYDGRESVVRNQPTRLTRIIAQGMRRAAGDVDVAMFNSGGIRLDDVLPPGTVSEYDIIRVMPFGGEILTVEMTGGLLDSVLTQGVASKGTGGFLQVDGAIQDGSLWLVGDDYLVPSHTYRVAVNDFLVSGHEPSFRYLTLDDPRMRKVGEHGDIRMAVIEEFKRRFK